MIKTNILDRISFIIFSSVIFLLPFFFIPATTLSLPVGKGLLFSIGIIFSFVFWLIAKLVDGRIIFPKSRVLFLGLVITLVFLLSALFSPSIRSSFLASGFEIGTAGSALLLFISMFLSSVFFSDKKKTLQLYKWLGFSFAIVALVAIVDIIAGPSSSLVKFLPVNLIGGWNDLAIFSGLIFSLSLLSIELSSDKMTKIFSLILGGAALFFLAATNFSSVWIIVGLISFFIFIYSFVLNRSKIENDGAKVRFPSFSFAAVLICLVFVIAGNLFGNFLPNRLHIDNTEIRPSLSATYDVGKQALARNPILGVGPNRFVNSWLEFKPDAVNQSLFWNSDFNFGFGLVPTFAVTTGLLGALTWIVFFALFLISGFVKSAAKNQLIKTEILTPFLSALFLWIFAVIYTPSLVNFALAFIMTGVFLGSLVAEKRNQNFDFYFLKDPRLSFFSILLLVSLTGGSLASGFVFAKKFAGVVYFQKSVFAPNTKEGIGEAEKYLSKALLLDESDLYYRALSQVFLIKLGSLLRDQNNLDEAGKAEIQLALNQAEATAKASIAKDSSNYQNWLSLASVYEGILPFGVQGAYENAKDAVGKAIVLNPKNPGLYLRLALVEIAGKNIDQAERDLNMALELRPNDKNLINYLEQIKALKGE